ncbi:acyl-CoA dehydrogenase family protein [Paralcaligenes ureilyticus]|uniref:Butyryl-CoA dehydrogenase n=1 Tax=Paralcaligenes ureilyticus TaxID=627131 RepID=A0A4V2UXJ7_9BURK|nr:acyl-CoA dehydrogenase family protein [Paralcaligenes ureilyticus]TCT03758.1 butyryl-CoA dehydrogenase [Paralcaligenes ureilyticus]
MNFTLTHEQQQLREAARKFAAGSLRDVARQVEEDDEPVSRDWVKKFAAVGFLGINIKEQYGGQGLSHLDAVLVLEEVAKISPAVAFPIFESCFGPMLAIQHFAGEELKQRVIPKVCAGEWIVAVSMSEPDAGSALTDLKTRAVVLGDKLIINGQKRWCSGAGHSDAYVVYCRLSDEPGAKSIGAVYVEKGSPGLTFGKRERLMGFRGIASADMYFDNVEVPLAHLIVPAGGFKKLMEAFDLERCGNATMSLALAAGALEYVLDYVQERQQFGKPIVEFQAVQIKLAEMAMRVDAARLLLYRAVINAQEGLPSAKESSMAKCFANEMVREVCGSALQLMGGYGYNKEYPMEQRLRDAWGWGIAGGAIDIQKINIASALVDKRFDQRR